VRALAGPQCSSSQRDLVKTAPAATTVPPRIWLKCSAIAGFVGGRQLAPLFP